MIWNSSTENSRSARARAKQQSERGFSLIELLVVMSIVGLMSSVILVNLTKSTRKSRDARRKNDIAQLQKAIQLYFDDKRVFPPNADNDGAGWDESNDGSFLDTLVSSGYLKQQIVDPRNTATFSYSYQLYNQGSTNCTSTFYILGVRKFENDPALGGNAQCPGGQDWDTLFDYVMQISE